VSSQDLVRRDPMTGPVSGQELENYKEQVRLVAQTEFVPKAYRGKPHSILAAILFGREIGLAPMESLAEVYMVDGRPSLSAKAMLKLARQAGHSITGEADHTKAVVRGKRGDNGDEMTVTYTLEMAKRAGLLSKDNWQQNPEDMVWARAVSRLCRRLFGDVFGSLPYGPEELEVTAETRMAGALEELPPDSSVVVDSDFEDSAPDCQDDLSSEASGEGNEPASGAEQVSFEDMVPEAVKKQTRTRGKT